MLKGIASWAGIVWMPVAEDVPAGGASGDTSPLPQVVADTAMLIRGGANSVGLADGDYPEALDVTKRSPVGNYADKTRKRVARVLYPDMDAEAAARNVSSAIRNVGTKAAPNYRVWIVLNETGQANRPAPLPADADADEDDS